MAVALQEAPVTYEVERPDEFVVVGSDEGLGHNLPQKAGRKLWAPMFVMALMAFPAALVLAVFRANEVASGGEVETIAALGQFVPAASFLGFAAVFGAIVFAIARILGQFRQGGGEIQEEAGSGVHTLKMPLTARGLLALMMMGMMLILAAVAAHVVIGSLLLSDGGFSLATAEQWSIWLEGIRRVGVAIYLFAIALGLGTIIHVLRFQSVRIRELAAHRPVG